MTRASRWCTAAAVCVLLGLDHPVAGQTTPAIIAVGTDATVPGDQGTIPVTLTDGLGRISTLGGDLLYVPEVLTPRTCFINPAIGPGTATDKSLASNVVAPGRLRWIIFGINRNALPDGTLFTCNFAVAAAAAPGTTMLQLDMIAAADPDANAVPVTLVPGQITITRCGDVNGDGVVDIGDELVVAQYDVQVWQCGERPFAHPEACDVAPDGHCDIGDALRIAQCDVGLVSCAFSCQRFACP